MVWRVLTRTSSNSWISSKSIFDEDEARELYEETTSKHPTLPVMLVKMVRETSGWH